MQRRALRRKGPFGCVELQHGESAVAQARADLADLAAVALDRRAGRRQRALDLTGNRRRLMRPRYLVRAVSSWPM